MSDLIEQQNQMWGRLYDLCHFTIERLDHEGNWLPEKYNQETDFDDEELQEKILEDGDWTEDQFEN